MVRRRPVLTTTVTAGHSVEDDDESNHDHHRSTILVRQRSFPRRFFSTETKPSTIPSSSVPATTPTTPTTPSTNDDNTTNLPAPPTIPIDWDTQCQIQGEESHVALIELKPGQVLRAESGAMRFLTDGVDMTTELRGLSAALQRTLTGQNVFVTDYAYHGGGSGTVGLGTDFPAKILRLNLTEHPQRALICQRGAYLAGDADIQISTHFQHSLTAGFFGGQGFILQRLELPSDSSNSNDSGSVLIQGGGTVVRKDLTEGEVLRVTSGSIVAFEASVDYNVEFMKGGVSNIMFSGQGLFMTTLTGPGTVWLQGLPADRMIAEIARRVPTGGGGIGWGVPIGMGGGGGAEQAGAAGAGDVTGAGDSVAAGDAVVEAERQATVATSDVDSSSSSTAVDADSPNALFGDVAGTPPPSPSYGNDDLDDTSSSTETTFTDDSSSFFGDDEPTSSSTTTTSQEQEFFSGSTNTEEEDPFGADNTNGPADGELFDDSGSSMMEGGDDEEGGVVGSMARTLWDIFTGDDD
mmetsp:Transcript_18580/g.50794  ORF Transcript_18580/g.50794 Transcript_18580/m.50794 type:complete len:521 (+) Transcript_18580:2-1564(+)